jgi:hypothetical protein
MSDLSLLSARKRTSHIDQLLLGVFRRCQDHWHGLRMDRRDDRVRRPRQEAVDVVRSGDIGGRLPTQRLMTRNSAMIAASFVAML